MKIRQMFRVMHPWGMALTAVSCRVACAASALDVQSRPERPVAAASSVAGQVDYRADAYRFRSALEQNIDIAKRDGAGEAVLKQGGPVRPIFGPTLEKIEREAWLKAVSQQSIEQLDRGQCFDNDPRNANRAGGGFGCPPQGHPRP